MKHCAHKNHSGANPVPLTNFSKRSSAKDGLQSWCKKCTSKDSRNRRGATRLSKEERLLEARRNRRQLIEASPENNVKFLLRNIKGRCKKTGVPFDVTIDDFSEIPIFCPVLHVELIYGNRGKASPQSAAIDKVIPRLFPNLDTFRAMCELSHIKQT